MCVGQDEKDLRRGRIQAGRPIKKLVKSYRYETMETSTRAVTVGIERRR